MSNTCVRFFVFINHFSSSVCVSSCNQRVDYLIGLGYSDLKMRVWWSQDSNDDYAGIIPMVNISSEKRLPSLWRHTSHHKEGTLHNTISKSLPPENIKWGASLRTIVFFSRGFFLKWYQHYTTGGGLGQGKRLTSNVILLSRQ